MLIAIIAAGCMVVQDVIAVIMVQAEAANAGWLAGICDTIAWYFGIETTSISVGALHSHSTIDKIYVLGFVGAANLIGTKLGQVTGKKLVKGEGVKTAAALTVELTAVKAELASIKQHIGLST